METDKEDRLMLRPVVLGGEEFNEAELAPNLEHKKLKVAV